MDSYGYYGEVSYQDQNRFRPYSIAGLGQDLLGVRGLGALQPVLSGGYRGQPGRLILPRQPPSRELDHAMLRSLDIQLAGISAGPLGATDREICSTLLSTAGSLATAASGAFGSRPVRRSGETQAQYDARLREWQIATRTTTTGGNVLSSTSALCNLIDDASQTTAGKTPSTSPSDWQLMQARAELERRYAEQQGGGVNTTTLLLIGGGLAAAAAAYFLLFR